MIHFTGRQLDRVIENHRKWRKGELGRPIIPMIISGADPGRPVPKAPLLAFSNCGDLSVPAEAIIDRFDYELSTLEFYGDSFPTMNLPHFGPGVMAAFMGAALEPANDTVWFHYDKKTPIEELHLEYDESNIWFNRIKDIYAAGMKKWEGNVCMCMTDLGGNLDILAHFLSTEKLLLELVDHPEEVKRLCNEITGLWQKYFFELTDMLKGQRAYSDWSAAFSENPTYILQCDFSYMISNSMFHDFVYDDLAAISSVVENPFYHLDGTGALKHLDELLGMDTIKGIQWVPGSGEPETRDWSEVYSKISNAGKKIMAGYDLESYMDEILKVVKKPDDLMKMRFIYPMDKKEDALKKLAAYGAYP